MPRQTARSLAGCATVFGLTMAASSPVSGDGGDAADVGRSSDGEQVRQRSQSHAAGSEKRERHHDQADDLTGAQALRAPTSPRETWVALTRSLFFLTEGINRTVAS